MPNDSLINCTTNYGTGDYWNPYQPWNPQPQPTWPNYTYTWWTGLTEDQVRMIIREELQKYFEEHTVQHSSLLKRPRVKKAVRYMRQLRR